MKLSRNSDYWGNRLERIAHNQHTKSTDEILRQLEKEYGRLNKMLEDQIERIYFDMLENGGEISTTKLYEFGRYKNLSNKFKKQLEILGSKEIQLINNQMDIAYQEVLERTADEVGLKSFSMLPKKEILTLAHQPWSGKDFSTRIWTNKDKMLKILRIQLKDTVGLGLSKDKAVANIMAKMGVGFNDADRLVRSEVMNIINTSQRDTYKQRGYTQVEWLTASDERVCKHPISLGGRSFEGCRGADGAIFDIDGVISIAHARCRCTQIPVLEGFE